MSKVSVVILNWNGRRHLERFLPSVVCHSPAECEVVVADNGSKDDSLMWLRLNYPDVRIINLDRNYGFAEGYNRAMKEITSEYVVLLNSDVEVVDGWLTPLVEVLDKEADVAAVAPKLLSVDEREKFEYAGASGGFIDYLGYPFCRGRILGHVEKDVGQYDDRRDVFWVSGAAMCCRRRLFVELGGFDADFFAHMEEIDLQWRMQLAGWRIVICPRSKVYHLGGGTLPNSSHKVYLNHRNNLAMLYKCSTTQQRIVVAVIRPFTDLAEAVTQLIMLHPHRAWAIARAWWSFLKWHVTLAAKRKAVQRKKRVSGVYGFSIIVRYLCGWHTFKRMM